MEVLSLTKTPQRRFVLVVIAAFFALSALVYGKAVWTSEFVRWDDGMLVYENPVIRSITPRSVGRIFSMYDPELYIPLTFLTYQIDYQIGGIEPFQYHLTSFLFHTLNGLLVAWFAALFFKKRWIGVFCGLVFLLHPLHTEAIMWVSGRKDLLSTFFFLLTLIYWMRWREDRVRRFLILSVGFFALALLSKIVAVTLPIILVLLDWRERRIPRRPSGASLQTVRDIFTEKIPFFALSILFGLIGIGGKTGVVASSSTWEKIIMAGKSSLFYLQKIVWPDSFSLLYPYHDDVVITSPDFYGAALVWGIIIAGLTAAYIAARYGRIDDRIRDVIFGLAFYLVTLAPTFLNFTKGGDLDVYFASDRYAYIPSIGAFIAIIAMAIVIGRKVPWKMGIAAGAVIVIILGYRSGQQSRVWANTYDLLSNVLLYYPESHVAHNNIANAWRLEGRLDDAIGEFEKALAIKQHPKIYANMGAVYRKQGKLEQAKVTYGKALAINPQSKEALMGRGLVWFAEKNYSAAEKDFLSALEVNTRYLEAHTNLGATYMAVGKVDDAITQYRLALQVNPFFPDATYNLGVALMEEKDFYNAEDAFARTVSMAPNFIPARINYAILLNMAGYPEKAKEQFREVLQIDPKNASAIKALQQLGR